MDINNHINYEGILDELTTNENDYLQYLNSPDDYDLNLDEDKISTIAINCCYESWQQEEVQL
jgi:hypothetical protein